MIFTLTFIYIVLGTFFEEMSSILITLPLILPIIVSSATIHYGGVSSA